MFAIKSSLKLFFCLILILNEYIIITNTAKKVSKDEITTTSKISIKKSLTNIFPMKTISDSKKSSKLSDFYNKVTKKQNTLDLQIQKELKPSKDTVDAVTEDPRKIDQEIKKMTEEINDPSKLGFSNINEEIDKQKLKQSLIESEPDNVDNELYIKMFKISEFKKQKEETTGFNLVTNKTSSAIDFIANKTGQGGNWKKTKELTKEISNKAAQRIQDETSNFWVSVPLFKNILGRTCFKDIGCFSASEYQDLTNRPIPLLPMSPDFINPSFHIYTLDNKFIPNNFSYNATEEHIKADSKFNPKLKTAIIVHGYLSGLEDWLVDLKDFIFNQSDNYNVICVNWEKGSKVPMYLLAATNTRVVGALIAFFIKTLGRTYNVTNDSFHLIGHSLGGHTMGYAGKRLENPKVGRITALDPAGVGFHFDNAEKHLHRSDATFVDAFHTDSAKSFHEGYGATDLFGSYDFFPNGGYLQPGCRPSRGITNLIQAIKSGDDVACSHGRGWRFALSLGNNKTDCQPLAYECESYELFSEGRCTQCKDEKCQLMGLHLSHYKNRIPSPKTFGYKYYVNTAPFEEFCVYHYQMALHITQDSDVASGLMVFIFSVKVEGEVKELEFEKIMSLTQIGDIHTLLITFEFKIEKFIKLKLKWNRFTDKLDEFRKNKGKKMKIPFIEINYMSHIKESVRKAKSIIMCPIDGPEAEIHVKAGPFELRICNKEEEKRLTEYAIESVPEVLVSFSNYKDLYCNDYENQNYLVVKFKENLVNQGQPEQGLSYYFG